MIDGVIAAGVMSQILMEGVSRYDFNGCQRADTAEATAGIRPARLHATRS
jgi:hypothetical protein